MPRKKEISQLSPEGAEGKDSTKVTKQEVSSPLHTYSRKPADDKAVKGKKGGAKGKKEEKEAVPTENGETKAEGICISRSSVTVSPPRSLSFTFLSVRGQWDTVRVKRV
uniref:High mobility group nucleosome-binding domain-containing protein 3 n=1 Tax=Pygocentrus nattereri TaxID=42514 RepID=A0A3B4EIZ5_PYGNA